MKVGLNVEGTDIISVRFLIITLELIVSGLIVMPWIS
jgi:hypothetical protein